MGRIAAKKSSLVDDSDLTYGNPFSPSVPIRFYVPELASFFKKGNEKHGSSKPRNIASDKPKKISTLVPDDRDLKFGNPFSPSVPIRLSVAELASFFKHGPSLPSSNMEKPSRIAAKKSSVKNGKVLIAGRGVSLAVHKLKKLRQTLAVKQYKKSHQGNGPNGWKKPSVHEQICISASPKCAANSGSGPSSSVSCIEEITKRVDLLREKLALSFSPGRDVISDYFDWTCYFCWVSNADFISPPYSQLSGECWSIALSRGHAYYIACGQPCL